MPPDVALFLPALEAGGAERVMLEVARGLAARGHHVDLVLGVAEGEYLGEVPREARVVTLGARRTAAALPGLVRYLARERPRSLLTTMNHANVIALVAGKLAGTPRIVVREASNVSGQLRDATTVRTRAVVVAMRVTYRWASKVLAVSQGAREDLARHVRLDPARVEVVYNPIDYERLRARAAEPIDPRILAATDRPLALAVGRLSPEKGFDVLLRAYAPVARDLGATLLILGEGPERGRLERAVAELGIERYVSLPGFVANPFPYIARASVLVLPSRWEGLPNVLIQALALGTPVVATDCPGGSREILDGGRLGALVPVDDVAELQAALRARLEAPARVAIDGAWLDRFDARRVLGRYEAALGLAR